MTKHLSMAKKGHPYLKMKAEPVEQDELPRVKELIPLMFETMYLNKGAGLAAPQVRVLKRVIVMHANGFKQAIINPVITKRYGGRATALEGCLSFPGVKVRVTRSKQVIIEGFDQDWNPIKRKLKGLAARCAQHEIDHLDGITIEDYK